MRRFLSILISLIMFFSAFNTGTLLVKAEGEHQFIIKAYDWNAFDNDGEGSGTGDELTQNSDVEPGRIIQVQLYYVPGTDPTMLLQMHMKYDDTLVEPVYYEGEFYAEVDMSTTYQGGMWPAKSTLGTNKNQTNWVVSYNDAAAYSKITCEASDSLKTKPLETEGAILTTYFQIKEDAPVGSVINFEFDDQNTLVDGDSPKITQGLTLNVFGEMSTNTTLDTLSVSNGNTIYDLDPVFVPGSSTTKEFNVVVPNHITSVDVDATATDSYAVVASGTGNNNLNVGNNDINLIVQAQNGTQEIYKLHVYRLNNDATLSSLFLTNDVDIGTFNSSITSYTAIVPYSTDTTIINASQTDDNAEIVSGTGTFSLINYGSSINTRNVVVNAENCKDAYTTVPGNSCTSKTYKIDITRTSPSSNTNLSDLTIDGITINGFNSGIYTYDLGNIPYETTSIDVNAVVEDTGKAVIVSGIGTKNLSVGDNTADIVVQAEDGSTKTYTITAHRLSNNSKLSSLTVTSNPVGTLSPTFSSTLYDYYTYTAPSTVETVTVTAEVEDTGKATIISGLGEYNIDTTNTVNILVQAEDGTQSTYVVKLVRSKSSNTNLKSLSIDGYNLNETFSPDNTLYTATVSGEVTKVNISAEVEDTGKATIISGLGEKELSVGNNIVQVRVQAENGSTKDYTITITRARKTVSALTDLKVDGVSIDGFEETVTEYTLSKVDFTKTSLNIEANLKDSDSTVTGTGIVNLNTGDNKLYVTVTAQDGVTQTTYIINVEREKDSNAYLKDLQIDGTTIEDFVSTTLSYGVTVPNEITSLNLNAIAESDTANVTITGNSNFVTNEQNTVLITVIAEDGSMQIYKIYVTREKSDNNYLKSISLSDGVLNPVFDKLTNDYVVNVDRSVTAIDITAEVEDSSSQYEVTGPSTLVIGANTFKITVTSETGKDNIYTIVVNRLASNNNYLSNLQIDGTTIENFIKTTELYSITVPSTKTSITLSATTEEVHATTSGLGTFDIVTGVNTFPVVVTAEDGTERTYSVVITREKSNNSALSDLSITQTTISPIFNPSTLNYTASVAYGVTNIDIVAIASDSKSIVTGDGNKDLNTGDNTFNVVVTSENNTTTTYTIVVTRAKNNNANLSNIILSGGFTLDKTFDPNETDYSVNVPNATESINITAYKQDPNAVSVTGAGLINLTTGTNNIKIVVTAEDGITTKTYNITFERAKSSDATLKELSVNGGTLNPIFDSNVTSYEVIVPYEINTFDVTATLNSDSATMIISDDKSLEVGANTKTITVTAEDGTLKVYEISVLRQPSTNNFLKNLSVVDKNSKEYITAFNSTTVTYDITVENDIDTLTISATVDDDTSTLTGTGLKDIDIGNNTFNLVVKSGAGIERTYTVNVFRKANSNNYLSSLEIENQTLSPTFEKNTISYTVNVDSLTTSVNIIATPEVETSTISGIGEFSLVTGVNTFNINVTAEDTSVKTYVIVVNKAASSNNYLSNLTVTPGDISPEFNKETLEYNMHVSNTTQTLTIDAEKEHDAAIISGTGVKSISVGEQTFEIVVTAEDNTTRTYKINVTRDASSVKDLKTLMIDGTLVDGFNKDVTSYSVNVDNSVDKVNISADVIDETSSITGIGEISLVTGNNVIPVTVTAEDGSIKVYEININRAKSSNNYLSDLIINEGDYTPEFDKETLTYNITVPYEITSLGINATKEDESSTIEIDSNSNFIVGLNKVYVNVIAENGDIRSYVINATRQQQANNFLTSIVVTGNDGVNYALSPTFDKNTYSYDVELPGTITDVDIAVTKESLSLTVTGDGKVDITSFPQTQRIIVSTTGGLERTYTLRFVKGLSSNNKLKSISVDKGILDPSFNEEELAYNVDLPAGTKEITISAVKGEEGQEIIGLGTKTLTSGRNTFKIVVTAENGNIRTYTIFVNVPSTNEENGLTSLIVDKGTLSPVFNKDTKLYTVDLDESEENITISATGNNSITGTGLHSLEVGANVFEIISTDDNGSENKYRVVVNRGSVQSPYLNYLQVDNYDMNEEFNKENLDYTMNIYNDITSLDVIAVPEDKNATVTITGNTNMVFGENTISIVVTDEMQNTKTYNIKVTIGNSKITSDVHTIGETYIETIVESQTASEVKSQMTNPSEYLKIYNIDGTELLDTDVVGTGCLIKLIINGTEYDSKILIIKGDVNGDGEVGVADIIKLRLHILESTSLTVIEKEAADTNLDDDIGVADLIQIRSHILGNSNLYGKEV